LQLSPLFHEDAQISINYLSILPPPGLMRRQYQAFHRRAWSFGLGWPGFSPVGLFLKLSKTASSRGRTERSLLR
jgi:hypothetical protein